MTEEQLESGRHSLNKKSGLLSMRSMRSNVSFSVKQEEQEDIDQRVDQVLGDIGGLGRY